MDLNLEEEGNTYQTPPFRFRHDVFLNFKPDDTSHTFVTSLFTALDANNVRTFRHDDGLDRDAEIPPSVLSSIADSAASVVILSENYANSTWCLEELAKILECGRLVLPVFYRVDPSNVRRRVGPFEEGFANHVHKFGKKSDKWKEAFQKIGDRSGYHTDMWEESELIKDLVKRILTQLSNTPLDVAKYPVGINSRVANVMRTLDVKSNDVRIVGFHGMGGIGKTTLARAVYNKIVTQFEHRSFISNVRTISRRQNGLVYLQNKLIHDLFIENAPPGDVSSGIATIKMKIHQKRVLIVLDDVDEISQLDTLVGKRDWFYAGSRIIITTRDKLVLVQPLVNETLQVEALSQTESLQLFSYHAFGKEKPNESFLHLSESIVDCTGRLPLALEVLGAFLYDKRRKNDWEDQLKKLKQIYPGDLHSVLKISFDGLDDQNKCIFLDMACFFVDMEIQRESVIEILKGCGFIAEKAITVLTAKALIKIVDGATLWMHDQLRDMGRQIVIQESITVPGKRSRLWDWQDIIPILKHNKGTGSTEGIVLNFEKNDTLSLSAKASRIISITHLKEKFKNLFNGEAAEDGNFVLDTTAFAPMVNLRLLQINYINLKGGFKLVPRELRWLQWKGCPLESLPSDFLAEELAVLDLSESNIKQLWGRRFSWRKVAMKLMVLNLFGCFRLTETPDFSEHPNLEKLVLERCTKLTRIHKSVGGLNKLRILNLNNCSNLVEFPDDISGLRCLERFTLNGCSKLKKLPEYLGSMEALKELLLDETAIITLPDSVCLLTTLEILSLDHCMSLKELPTSIGRLGSLRRLSLNGSNLVELPDSIGCLTNLQTLWLMNCKSLLTIPDSIGQLKSLVELCLDGSSIKELPLSIGSLSQLKCLSVTRCMLDRVPGSIGGLSSLEEFKLNYTLISELPDEIGSLNMLQKLEMRNCKSFCCLPDSIGSMYSLKHLVLLNTVITELPESIGLLENLVELNVNKCKLLQRIPSSIGKLRHLRRFLMEGTSVTKLPEECGMLSSLLMLKMSKPWIIEQARITKECRELAIHNAQENVTCRVLPVSFSNLSLLETLVAKNCMISGIIPDDFEKLTSLENLDLDRNIFCRLPSSMRGLCHLKRLSLTHCSMLRSLPPLPSSLTFVDATNCTALVSISDLSNLKNLEELRLTNCKNVTDIPGLECLKSLKRLYMIGCTACHSVIKGRLSESALRQLRNLTIPGSELPKLFVQGDKSFFSHPNRKIEGVIICLIISLDQQTQDNFRDQLPAIVDIEARIVRDNVSRFTTALYLIGVPNTDNDHIYLCRYPDIHPLVSMLKDGDKIEVTMRNPPCFNGIQLKKYGIHLFFEGDDDDYNDTEEPLDGIEKSVSKQLMKDLKSSEGNDSNVDFHEVQMEDEDIESTNTEDIKAG